MLLSLLRGVWLFGAARRLAAAAAELLLRPLQVQGQAARPCCTPTPTRPAALFRAPSLPKKRGFSGRKFLPPGSISILHIGRASIDNCAVWGPLSQRDFQTTGGVGISATFQKFHREFPRRRQSRIVNNCQQRLD